MRNLVVVSLIWAFGLLSSCSLVFDDSKIEGKWWMSKNVSPASTVIYDSKDKSANVADFKSDRTFTATDPATGDQSKGRWTIDTTSKTVTIYLNSPSAGTEVKNYDFPEYNKLKMIDPTNSSYYIEFTRN